MLAEGLKLKVSVCIPAYNYAHYLGAAIDSVLAQTFQNFELLVIDNCSTDETPELVAAYVKRDSRITYLRNEANLGLVGNLNRCVASASGELIKILCADDLLAPDCLAQSVAVLDNQPQVALVAHARRLVDEQLRSLAVRGYGRQSVVLPGTAVIRKCLVEGNLIGEPSAAMFRNGEGLPVFSQRYRQLMDLDFWFSLLEKGDFAYLPEPLGLFRQHAGQESIGNIASFAYLDDEKALLQNYLEARDDLTLSRWERFRWRLRIAYAIWGQRKSVQDTQLINAKIAEFLPWPLFYLLLPAKLLSSKMRQQFDRHVNVPAS